MNKPFNDYREREHWTLRVPGWLFALMLIAGYALALSVSGCTERKTLYSYDNVPIAQDSTVCDWHENGPAHAHHGRFCCFLGKRCGHDAESVTKEDAENTREGNPEFNTGGGLGGGDR